MVLIREFETMLNTIKTKGEYKEHRIIIRVLPIFLSVRKRLPLEWRGR